MSDRLITLATFSTTVDANLARAYLESHGIPVSISDEHIVNTLWSIGTAVNGVKLIIHEKHSEQAVKLMDDYYANAELDEQGELPPEEEAEENEEEAEENEKAPTSPPPIVTTNTPHDALADRAMRCALFGLFLCPLSYAAGYFLLKIAFTDGELSPDGRWRQRLALFLVIAGFLLQAIYLNSIL